MLTYACSRSTATFENFNGEFIFDSSNHILRDMYQGHCSSVGRVMDSGAGVQKFKSAISFSIFHLNEEKNQKANNNASNSFVFGRWLQTKTNWDKCCHQIERCWYFMADMVDTSLDIHPYCSANSRERYEWNDQNFILLLLIVFVLIWELYVIKNYIVHER